MSENNCIGCLAEAVRDPSQNWTIDELKKLKSPSQEDPLNHYYGEGDDVATAYEDFGA